MPVYVVSSTYFSEDRDEHITHVLGVAKGQEGIEAILRDEGLEGTVELRHGTFEVTVTNRTNMPGYSIDVSDHELK